MHLSLHTLLTCGLGYEATVKCESEEKNPHLGFFADFSEMALNLT